MARLVNKPLLRNDLTVSVVVNRARIGSSTDHLSPFHFRAMCRSVLLSISCLQPLVEQVISVDRGDSGIAVAMESDQRDNCGQLWHRLASPSSHCLNAGAYIICSTVSQPGMHTNGSVKIGICHRHNHGHSSS